MSKTSDFFFSEDITYCMDGECLRTECIRHRSRAPIGVPLSWANMKYQEGCLLEKIKALPSAKDIDVSNKVRKKMMMSDLISRKAAIDAIFNVCKSTCTLSGYLKKAFEKLPSAQPERKEGKWITRKDVAPYRPDGEITSWTYKCEYCGTLSRLKYNYCHNCGAKMDKGGDAK